MPTFEIMPIDRNSNEEIELVATRMRDTLIEVLGEERGRTIYTMEWLKKRVLFHLDPDRSTGEVFVARDSERKIVGHTIVRIDKNDAGEPIGLFSTIYVEPTSRRNSLGKSLIQMGEAWLHTHEMTEFHTYTDIANQKLINLFKTQGYEKIEERNEFAILVKRV